MSSEIQCPQCGSNQLTASKKGYSLTKGVAGMVLTGGVGLLGGLFGSNKVEITCLACGKVFKPGEGKNVSLENKIIENFENNYTPANNYSILPEEEMNDIERNVSDNTGDFMIKETLKSALEAEYNEDYDTASLWFYDCIRQSHDNGLELDEKILRLTIKNCKLANAVRREFLLYEDLVLWYPFHSDVEKWKIQYKELYPQVIKSE